MYFYKTLCSTLSSTATILSATLKNVLIITGLSTDLPSAVENGGMISNAHFERSNAEVKPPKFPKAPEYIVRLAPYSESNPSPAGLSHVLRFLSTPPSDAFIATPNQAELTVELESKSRGLYESMVIAGYSARLDTAPMEALLNSGADPSYIDPYFSESTLHNIMNSLFFFRKGSREFFKLLIDKSSNIEVRDSSGDTPLHKVAMQSNVFEMEGASFKLEELIDLILEKGADIESQNDEGSTPLHIAAQHGNTSVAQILSQRGASFSAKDHRGRTPIEVAIASDRRAFALLFSPEFYADSVHQAAIAMGIHNFTIPPNDSVLGKLLQSALILSFKRLRQTVFELHNDRNKDIKDIFSGLPNGIIDDLPNEHTLSLKRAALQKLADIGRSARQRTGEYPDLEEKIHRAYDDSYMAYKASDTADSSNRESDFLRAIAAHQQAIESKNEIYLLGIAGKFSSWYNSYPLEMFELHTQEIQRLESSLASLRAS